MITNQLAVGVLSFFGSMILTVTIVKAMNRDLRSSIPSIYNTNYRIIWRVKPHFVKEPLFL